MRVYNENGRCVLDNTTGILKILGTFKTGTSIGEYVDNRLREGRFWYVVLSYDFPEEKLPMLPSFTVVDNKLQWVFERITDSNSLSHANANSTILYGIY